MQKQMLKIKKNDKVKVIAGRERGKIGKVLKIDHKKERMIIENINMIKRHMKPSAMNRQGGIVEKEAPIHLSNAMLMCGKCMRPTRVGHRILQDGKKVRYCKKCNEIIDG